MRWSLASRPLPGRCGRELPTAFDSPDFCMAALQRLCDSGQHGLVVMGNGRDAAVMAAAARENPAVGRYALLLAEGFAVDPDLTDPTGVLAAHSRTSRRR